MMVISMLSAVLHVPMLSIFEYLVFSPCLERGAGDAARMQIPVAFVRPVVYGFPVIFCKSKGVGGSIT